MSLALTDTMKTQGRYWSIPPETYPRMDQGAVLLKQASKAGHSQAAKAFLEAVRSESGRAILQRYGFTLPEPSSRR
jgi:molybdate transport system substrate-binding protein